MVSNYYLLHSCPWLSSSHGHDITYVTLSSILSVSLALTLVQSQS